MKKFMFLILFLIFLSALVAGTVQAAQSHNSGDALTNKDILLMLKAGLTPEVVIAKIKSSDCRFDTSPSALKDLKSADVSDAVILAMVQAIPAQPSIDQILDKYVRAIGGEQTVRKFNTLAVKGTLVIKGKSGTFEVYSKAPNKAVSNMQATENASWRMSEGFDGSVAWFSTPQTGVRDKSGQELTIAARSADFFGVLKLKELYPKMTLRGEQLVGNRQSYVVEADPGDGSLKRMYFDSETGLLLRSDLESDSTQGRRISTWYYEDYRDVDGMKYSFTRRQPDPTSGDTVYRATEVRFDMPIDDSKFAKPEGSAQAISAQTSSAVPPNMVKTLAYRVIPQQRTTYYQSGNNSSFTSCYGQGQFFSFGNYGNMNMNTNCNTTYTTPTQIPVTWQFADVYIVVEGSNQLYLIGCRANWRWSNCMPLIVGDMFPVEISGGKMTVTATKNGKKEIHAKYNILEVSPKQ
jgi:hypothetical protein